MIWLRFSCSQQTSMDFYKLYMQCSGSLLQIFSYHKVNENVKYFFSEWFSDLSLLVKNDQQWRTFRMIYKMITFRKRNFFPTHQLWRHKTLYLTWYLIFPSFWSHSVLLKIGRYTKSNLMIYNLRMFGKIIFVVTVNYDFIGI